MRTALSTDESLVQSLQIGDRYLRIFHLRDLISCFCRAPDHFEIGLVVPSEPQVKNNCSKQIYVNLKQLRNDFINSVYVLLLLSMYSYCSSMYS